MHSRRACAPATAQPALRGSSTCRRQRLRRRGVGRQRGGQALLTASSRSAKSRPSRRKLGCRQARAKRRGRKLRRSEGGKGARQGSAKQALLRAPRAPAAQQTPDAGDKDQNTGRRASNKKNLKKKQGTRRAHKGQAVSRRRRPPIQWSYTRLAGVEKKTKAANLEAFQARRANPQTKQKNLQYN